MSDRILHVLRRVAVVVGYVLVYVLVWMGLALLIAAAGIRYYWGEISVGQMLSNLVSVEIDGGGGSIIWVGILGIGVAPVLITAAIAAAHFVRRRNRRHSGDDVRPPRTTWFARSIATALVGAVVIGGTTAFATTVGVGNYIRAANSDFDLGDYYVEPTITSDENARNLVLIYLESGEATLEDDQLFEKDAFTPLKDVTRASEGWQNVENLQQYTGGGWTIAGISGTECGVPLKGTGSAAGAAPSNDLGSDTPTYLGGLTCAGDVLEEHGYTNVFLGGANSSFAAKESFLRSHGYSEVKGLADWRAAGEPEENFRSDWGLSDERLMDHAKDRIDELHAEAKRTGRPFNLSMLTLDTHEPAYVFDYCSVDTEHDITSVFSCSMAQVAGFVNHMKDRGYLDDTAVVIMGDHLKHMPAGDPFHEQLDNHPNRTIFNRIWVPGGDGAGTLRPRLDQLSMYPTILEAAGLTLKDGAAGLGVSAFATRFPNGSAQAMDTGPYNELLEALSLEFYADAWAVEDAERNAAGTTPPTR
ncbi:LTA synthase family protein [Arthrobacter sp. NPDC092385]|uniref:LTA synthase family protein n=1 Tax=Arthrobacter sp. NPDC092385 TaxID=3363943 RepID=UPI00380CEB36